MFAAVHFSWIDYTVFVAYLLGTVAIGALFIKGQRDLNEYLLAGRTREDIRQVLRDTMFAATVTGSPVENACRLIAEYEPEGRGYYASVAALIGHDADGKVDFFGRVEASEAEAQAGASQIVGQAERS